MSDVAVGSGLVALEARLRAIADADLVIEVRWRRWSWSWWEWVLLAVGCAIPILGWAFVIMALEDSPSRLRFAHWRVSQEGKARWCWSTTAGRVPFCRTTAEILRYVPVEEVVEACRRAVVQDEVLTDAAASLAATEEAAREVRRLTTPKEAS